MFSKENIYVNCNTKIQETLKENANIHFSSPGSFVNGTDVESLNIQRV